MQFSTSALAIVAFLAANVKAGCYSGGTLGTASKINPLMETICANLIGTYVKGETRYMCAMDLDKVQWNFSLLVWINFA